MGKSLDQILATTAEGSRVDVTMASNQDNGIVSYAIGSLVFHKGGLSGPGPGSFRPTRLDSTPDQPLKMFFSDRLRQVDPVPPSNPGFPTFPLSSRQPFDVDQTENLGVSLTLGLGGHTMRLSVFGSTSLVLLNPLGDVMVGLGPSLGNSAAGVFVVAFEQAPAPPK